MNTDVEKELPQTLHIKETNSTNQYIREKDEEELLPEGSLVWTDFQTSGRGQIGNSWEGERGQNLLFSLLLHPDFLEARNQFVISQIAALSVKKTLDAYTKGITVKWPNDIYWNSKKICGMLIENDIAGSSIFRSIIGIGLNINQKIFLSNAPNPVSLFQITGREYNRENILREFMSHFASYYNMLLEDQQDNIRKDYFEALFRGRGYHPYECEGIQFMAEIVRIESTGHLILREESGAESRYAFKEVSVVL